MRRLLPGAAPDRRASGRTGCRCRRDGPRIADGRILLAGDALSLINPLSGEGIFYAVTSGALGRARRREAGDADAGAAYRAAMDAALRSTCAPPTGWTGCCAGR